MATQLSAVRLLESLPQGHSVWTLKLLVGLQLRGPKVVLMPLSMREDR